MFSSKLYTTKKVIFIELKKPKVARAQLHFNFYRIAENVVCTIPALVVCTILGELKFLKSLKRQIILHIFITNFYPQINTFYKIKENERHMCTIAHELLQIRQERRMYNSGSPVK